ncbi:hypothetical protein F5Y15DRAFT_382100 [Xylariaceae sp. FL0016]|nr:hypothetical protein F5Y15DRAFT_382100 [Xylariaceae sp. FL0016]
MRLPRPAGRQGAPPLNERHWTQTLARLTSAPRRRNPFLKVSPTRVLALRMKSKKDDQKKRYAALFSMTARQRNERLPNVTLQMWMRKQDTSAETNLAKALRSVKASEWTDLLNSIATRGWTREHFDHWIWILSGDNGDVRVQRFLSTDTIKPRFLLFLLLRSDEVFRKHESLTSLMRYLSNKPTTNSNIATHSAEDLTVSQFLIVLRRLTLHALRMWPRSLVTIARLAAEYIKGLGHSTRRGRHSGYPSQCEVFNTALFVFSKPAQDHPHLNMEFNWRAQRLLLAMSDNLGKPLIINQASYRAIRQVLVALPKSKDEKWRAARYSQNWPPHRRDFDGLDAKRPPQDDHSRSVKAGILAKASGYDEDDYDRALDTLGGTDAGSPTIQTRSLAPKRWKDGKEEWNYFNRWAMSIRATRNAQEAWRAFQRYVHKSPSPPNIQVYAEMFRKLQAQSIDAGSDVLPGDARENFPVYDANYSEYELARLSPPTVAELYQRMLNQGIKPDGHCLQLLVSNSRSIEEGIRYLLDSPIDPVCINMLSIYKQPSYQNLRRIPLLAFSSYIQLLCRLQPDRRAGERIPGTHLLRLSQAIKLVKIRLVSETTEGATFRPPWHTILRALARPYIAIQNVSRSENDLQALTIFMDVLGAADRAVGIDTDMFIYLCRTIEKASVSQLGTMADAEVVSGEQLLPSVHDLVNVVNMVFSRLTASTDGDMISSAVADLKRGIGPVQLHACMRAMAFIDDHQGMVRVAQWMMENHEFVNEEAERMGNRGQSMVAKALCAFHAFAGPRLSEAQQNEMLSRMQELNSTGVQWRWPTAQEVERYVSADQRGASQKLRNRAAAAWWQQSPVREAQDEQDVSAAA